MPGLDDRSAKMAACFLLRHTMRELCNTVEKVMSRIDFCRRLVDDELGRREQVGRTEAIRKKRAERDQKKTRKREDERE